MARALECPFPLDVVDDALRYRQHFDMSYLAKQSRLEMMRSHWLPRDTGGCIISTLSPQSNGYVQISFGGYEKIRVLQHRLVWSLEHGDWPPADLLVLHDCDRRLCCAPEHLRLGTHKDNVVDMVKRGRRRSGQRLTAEQSELVRELHRQGHSLKTISLAMGIGRDTASRHIRMATT